MIVSKMNDKSVTLSNGIGFSSKTGVTQFLESNDKYGGGTEILQYLSTPSNPQVLVPHRYPLITTFLVVLFVLRL